MKTIFGNRFLVISMVLAMMLSLVARPLWQNPPKPRHPKRTTTTMSMRTGWRRRKFAPTAPPSAPSPTAMMLYWNVC